MDDTLSYYNCNANAFSDSTRHADMHHSQDKFLSFLPASRHILDFGCGSGRDTKYFLDHGYRVTAIDGSEEMCSLAAEYTGIAVNKMLFQDLDEKDVYDGIWACASVLHLPKNELLTVFGKMCAALKARGIVYASFKYGTFEGVRNGRYFIDFTDKSFCEFIKVIECFAVEEIWITSDVRPGRGDEKWLNVILRKADIH
jgi:SAM-dependent methyltransferase